MALRLHGKDRDTGVALELRVGTDDRSAAAETAAALRIDVDRAAPEQDFRDSVTVGVGFVICGATLSGGQDIELVVGVTNRESAVEIAERKRIAVARIEHLRPLPTPPPFRVPPKPKPRPAPPQSQPQPVSMKFRQSTVTVYPSIDMVAGIAIGVFLGLLGFSCVGCISGMMLSIFGIGAGLSSR